MGKGGFSGTWSSKAKGADIVLSANAATAARLQHALSRRAANTLMAAALYGMIGGVVACIALFAPSAARAAATSERGTLTLIFENDWFHSTDRHYTNGLRFSWLSGIDTTPKWVLTAIQKVPLFPIEASFRTNFAIGQNMYTPQDIRIADPPPGERPYAGWTYGSIGLIAATGRQFDEIKLTLGVVGPLSMAEQTQAFFHRNSGSSLPRGWDTQLGNEPGIVLAYQRIWRGAFSRSFGNDFGFEVSPHFGGALGNIHTYANIGLMMRFGMHLPIDYGPPTIEPNLPGSEYFISSGTFGWYVFFGVGGRAVARNIFLDGNTFSDSRSVTKKILVADLQYGIAVTWRGMRLSYAHVLRTKEFESQEESDGFGSISFSMAF
jgi:lipid A 3-O-deacylase